MSSPDDELDEVLGRIRTHPRCVLLAPAGPAVVGRGAVIPDDLRRFHLACGGAWLFAGAAFSWRISGPDQLVPASPRLLGARSATDVAVHQPDDLTNRCYVIADGGGASTDPHVVVDLDPHRAGRCYSAGWDTYGLVGEMPVVAITIAELLRGLLDTHGEAPGLPARHGDAYAVR